MQRSKVLELDGGEGLQIVYTHLATGGFTPYLPIKQCPGNPPWGVHPRDPLYPAYLQTLITTSTVWLGGVAVGLQIRDREVASSIPGC